MAADYPKSALPWTVSSHRPIVATTGAPALSRAASRGMKYAQSLITRRWDNLITLRSIFAMYPNNSSFSQLRECMAPINTLGEGVYGTVFEMIVKEHLIAKMPYSFALKMVEVNDVSKMDREEIVQRVMREIQSFGYTNGLVYLQICPNFTLAARTFFSKKSAAGGHHPLPQPPAPRGHGGDATSDLEMMLSKGLVPPPTRMANASSSKTAAAAAAGSSSSSSKRSPHHKKSRLCCMILMEREEGTLRNWVRANPTNVTQIMGAVLQIFMAICAMATHLELCHNDLYFKNILYNVCDSTNFKYVLSPSKSYVISGCTTIVKITDFGISTSPKVLDKAHMDMSHLVRTEVAFTGSFADYDFQKHILDYSNLQPYARDPAVVLRTLTLVQGISQPIITWATTALMYLDTFCGKNLMYTPKGTVDFTGTIFSSKVMARCGLPANLFDPPAAAAAAAAAATGETFYVDGSNIGNENTITEMLQLQVTQFYNSSNANRGK